MPFFVWQIHHLFFVILFLETESALKNLVASIDGEGKKYFFFGSVVIMNVITVNVIINLM